MSNTVNGFSMPEDQYQQFMIEVNKIHQRITDHYLEEEKFKEEIRGKLNPMYEMFVNAKGFQGITVWILKGLILMGSAVALIYAAAKWIKQ